MSFFDPSVVLPSRLTLCPDLQHNLFLLTFYYQLGLAPCNAKDSGVKRVLDVGTGTGLWAIEFADEHPEAEVRRRKRHYYHSR